ncbi:MULTISPECIES: 23S rRNA (pseudouridine(1915)-N(3))-methyltransferase RlmH [Spongiibacter]|jgi:23S rRNA (pseudouridine1915-N3)-methyltransferase|uniref:23S rRNA (pseudouridine(1915)-N(3))-methyltransferase RlmH n=1 Tax=Spongiibacter TaxID=630749 RepID=UPI0003B76235|nr:MULTISPECIES: 23S rRNA (pseudouridine(1915)-N(3))-methyltransferase RlmH [Spongiibacter]MAY39991.1 23S rRNA (pseudouridine(1915)-N(3))-methyltransferase RlmH [Spongiibacter sp.]MBI58131.1 23S rRNA (pseudouridine(1915)-N(3))-methyltransferase RlmH [Spongiibacter sp.]MBO6753675.1 23S rRNA (pseudouridine(1915)-N(3))-methyltransferase RlmH [Spongiibacter sp.]MBU71193.1 23S rRNA (pseudouridine(1915)-N(3))-methyltransferase RlmH [Spongiibacter sp.]|tara:strand:+ start:465 stop:932 length:468 start_codon:yes stop_codon:yes gene_type:complete
MRVSLICIGSKMPDWVEAGVAEYRKRLPADVQLDIRELPLGKRGKNTDIRRAITQEGEAMLAAVGKGDRIIALDVKGRSISTESLSSSLDQWRMDGDNVSILVGGPDGLASECLSAAAEKWSLSAMTLPHPLVRVMFAEQLYRAWTILANHPYHR